MAEIRQPWDDADSACPALPGRIYEKAGRDTHKHPKKQMAGPPMEYDDPDWKFAPTDNELPLQTAEQEREWLHHLQTALQESSPRRSGTSPGGHFRYRWPRQYKARNTALKDQRSAAGCGLRRLPASSTSWKDENQITPWQQAVALALKRVGNVQIDYEWAAVIGPRPTIWAHVKGLASPASVAHLNLAPGGIRYVEYTETRPPTFHGRSVIVSEPAIVRSTSTGFSIDAARRAAARDLHGSARSSP